MTTIPDFNPIISFVIDYTLMLSHKLELPDYEDYIKERDGYREIIAMAAI